VDVAFKRNVTDQEVVLAAAQHGVRIWVWLENAPLARDPSGQPFRGWAALPNPPLGPRRPREFVFVAPSGPDAGRGISAGMVAEWGMMGVSHFDSLRWASNPDRDEDGDADTHHLHAIKVQDLLIETHAVAKLGLRDRSESSPTARTGLVDEATWNALAKEVLPEGETLEHMVAMMLGAPSADGRRHPRYSENLAAAIKLWILLHNHPAAAPPSVRELCAGRMKDERTIHGVPDVLPQASSTVKTYIAGVVQWGHARPGGRPGRRPKHRV
jgi:hypothetical protein